MIAYRKVSDAYTTYQLRLPERGPGGDAQGPGGQEIATLPDGRTVVVLDTGAALPDEQPELIAGTIEHLPSPLPAELRETIRAASPHVALINQRVVEMIRQRYSPDDEIKLLRIAPSAETAQWNAYVEECRAWGRGERAKLGL